jgi:beta-lactamase superfamily II metal-dependent hydrolase
MDMPSTEWLHKEYNYLLTSDAEKSAFLNAVNQEPYHIKGINFHVCQMPHHGSLKNYERGFWDEIINFKIQNAIASSGNGYRHPSIKVLAAFGRKGYRVYCTNIVNGMLTYTSDLEKRNRALDPFSKLAEEYLNHGDRVFVIKDGFVEILS